MVTTAALLDRQIPRPTDIRRTGGHADGWPLAVTLNSTEPIGGPLTESGRLRILFDGYLFDRRELRRSLGLGDDNSDAELVLAVYRRDGVDGFRRLRGAFALVILDRDRDRVIAARDPIGLHPLFYAQRNGTIVFATSPSALAVERGPKAFNRAALADHLCHRWPDPGETYFAGVRRLMPGSWLEVVGERVRTARYWDPGPPDRPIEWLGEAEVARFDEVLAKAVDRCLDTGRTGIFLSGGLDSISIALVAADRARARRQHPPLALSLGFEHPSCDERNIQRAVAAELGLEQRLLSFTEALGERGLFTQVLALDRDWPAPVGSTWNPAYMSLAARGRSAGVDTILTGTGGDEWLTVSAFLAADLIRAGDLRGFARFVASWRRSYRCSSLVLARSILWTFGLRPLAGRFCYRWAPVAWDRRRRSRLTRSDPPWVAPDQALRQEQEARAGGCLPAADPPGGFYCRALRTALDHPMVTMELEERHHLGRRLGLRFLHPYWDADLVDLLFRTPPALLERAGRSKGLVRSKVAARLPHLGLDRQRKIAATSLHQSLLSAEAAQLLAAVGGLETLGALGIVDPVTGWAYVQQSLSLPGMPQHRAWELLNLEMWTRSFVDCATN
jgi:asparagine synthetase B (glutamine-hydrolysing)